MPEINYGRLFHYGKKGMRWGVTNEEKPSGGDHSGSSKPPEASHDELSKAMDSVYSKKNAKDMQAEGKKKLEEQAKSEFPIKGAAKEEQRAKKADDLDKQASDLDAKRNEFITQRDALAPGFKTSLKRAQLNGDIDTLANQRDALTKKAGQIRDGKFTDNQKLLIGVGAAAAALVLANQAQKQYARGYTKASKELLGENRERSSEQWRGLFGNELQTKQALGYGDATGKGFYAGLTSKKALNRPEFTIPEGTVFQRLSDHIEDSSEYGKIKGTYSTFLHNDNKLYGSSGEFGYKKYTVNFEANGPTRVPNLTTVMAHLKIVKAQEGKNLSSESLFETYHSLSGGNWSGETSKALFTSLRQHGYSALVDDMDAGYLGDLPVVFFGEAKPATSTLRTSADRKRDSTGILKVSGTHA